MGIAGSCFRVYHAASESPGLDVASTRTWSWSALALSLAGGGLVGLGVFTFTYAEGLSYFSTDPAACANCHIMQPQYDAWQKASHHTAATCVDCHLPSDFVPKYLAKAENGYFHSKGFTLQDFPEPIRIKPSNLKLLQDNCLRCHTSMVEHITSARTDDTNFVQCVHCHSGVGHGDRASLGGPGQPSEYKP